MNTNVKNKDDVRNIKNRLFMIDLFCGAGGVSEGAIQSGFYPIFSLDISKDVEKTYTNRHTQLGYIQNENTFFLREDIRNISGKQIFDTINNLKEIKKYGLKFGKEKNEKEIDLVFGGPSCQGFSMLGKRNKEDPRNKLFGEYVRVISEIQPKYVVMENVSGFLTFEFNDFKSIDGTIYTKENSNSLRAEDILIQEFTKIGYEIGYRLLLNASDFGVPQDRNRYIFIAYRKNQKKPINPIEFSTRQKAINNSTYDNLVIYKTTVKDAIEDIQEEFYKEENKTLSKYAKETRKGRTPKLYDNIPIEQTIPLNHEKPNHSKIIRERYSLYNIGESTSQLKHRILKSGINIENKETLKKMFTKEEIEKLKENPIDKENIDLVYKLITRKNVRKKLALEDISPTITTNSDDFISPYENRALSVREMARLQSFDDSFEFLGKRTTGGKLRQVEVPQYSQVGNAVPPLLAKAICDAIKSVL